jgi:hypothetical protein
MTWGGGGRVGLVPEGAAGYMKKSFSERQDGEDGLNLAAAAGAAAAVAASAEPSIKDVKKPPSPARTCRAIAGETSTARW